MAERIDQTWTPTMHIDWTLKQAEVIWEDLLCLYTHLKHWTASQLFSCCLNLRKCMYICTLYMKSHETRDINYQGCSFVMKQNKNSYKKKMFYVMSKY